MKIKGTAIATLFLSIIIVGVSTVYFAVGLPILNFIFGSPTPSGDHQGGVLVIDKSTDVLDMPSDGPSDATPDPNQGAMPPGNSISPGSTGSEVTQITGRQVSFADGSKNILLLGYNADEGLCDSIFILNIDQKTKVMKLVSVPRDAYVPYSEEIQNAMKAKGYYHSAGSFKINAVPYVGNAIVRYQGGKFGDSGIDLLCDILDKMLGNGCKIDEYVYVDFDGFMDIIDVVGGVEVTVKRDIYKNTGELLIPKGKQKLDARHALIYVRYRTILDENGHNTNLGGDTFRKTNQLDFLVEVSNQIVTRENLTVGKITGTMETLKRTVFHSFGDDISTLQEYISIGLDFADGKYSIQPYVIVGEEIDPFGDHASYVKIY